MDSQFIALCEKANRMFLKNVRNFPACLVFGFVLGVLWHKKVEWRDSGKFLPLGGLNICLRKHPILFLAASPHICIIDFSRSRIVAFLDTQQNSYTLLDVKHILILLAIWHNSCSSDTSVQIEMINGRETLHQMLSHAAENRAVKETVIDNIAENPFAVSVNSPLRPADKLDIVSLKNCCSPLTKRFPIYPFVGFNKFADERELTRAIATGIR